MAHQEVEEQTKQVQGIQLSDALPKKIAITECAFTQTLSVAQRTHKPTEHQEESDTTVTACIERTDVMIGKVRQKDHHHKDEAQRL
jgi:hypothetical protein